MFSKKYIRKVTIYFSLCIFAFSASAETHQMVFSTNLAYIGLTALSLSGGGRLIVVPIENQIGFSKHFSVNPSITTLYFGTTASQASGILVLGECGIGYHTHENELSGWCFSIEPGLVITLDTLKLAYSLSGEAGYQWILNNGLFVGLAVGGKSIWMDGNLLIPDLKLRIGYGF